MSAELWTPADPEATRPRVTDEDVVLKVMDSLAASSGMATSDAEYVGTLRAFGFTDEYVTAVARQYRRDAREITRVLRDGLRPTKMLGRILSARRPTPTPRRSSAPGRRITPSTPSNSSRRSGPTTSSRPRRTRPPTRRTRPGWTSSRPSPSRSTRPRSRSRPRWLGSRSTPSSTARPCSRSTRPPRVPTLPRVPRLYCNTARMTRFRFPREETETRACRTGQRLRPRPPRTRRPRRRLLLRSLPPRRRPRTPPLRPTPQRKRPGRRDRGGGRRRRRGGHRRGRGGRADRRGRHAARADQVLLRP